MTDEEMADVYVHNHIHYELAKREDGTEYAKKVSSVTIKEAFLAGLEIGKDINVPIKWHDLKKNPNDLPKKDKRFSLNVSITVMTQKNKFAWYSFIDRQWYSNGLIINPPIAWCEIPRFERETNGNTED